ncbi:MAG: hypothetical protein K2J76_02760 [Oscillospiraceae bacterium]|nr:hypothetical protein [Oscillospiraceae bacterium]
MKKLLSAVLSAILIFSLSSCGNSQPADESITAAAETSSFSESVTTVSETTEKPAETQTETSSVPETTFTEEVIETFTEATSQPYGESVSEQKVLMFTLYENEAWSFDRQVGILDSEGNYCYISHEDEGGEFLARENGNPLLDENWYQNLVDALPYGKYTWQDSKGNEYENKLPDEKLELVKEYTEKFGEYTDYPIRNYGNMRYDSGSYCLYGVYLDENNVPQYIKLCAYGDWAYCIYDDDIADFVNSINGYFFYTDQNFNY